LSQGKAPAEPRRLGVFGGAFDPPHCAHVALARTAIEQLQLDELRVIPTGYAWHKNRPLSSSEHRLQMTKLAFSGLHRVHVDDRELRRAGPTYTIDTLEALCAEQPGSVLFLVIGGDQLAAFDKWRKWQDILRLATVCVAQRLPQAGKPANFAAQTSALPDYLPLQFPAMPVSATDIRQRLAAQNSQTGIAPDLRGLVPEEVARYIHQHGLYQTRPISL
jgi:nicotinate-nucleotide adenylyltransferase